MHFKSECRRFYFDLYYSIFLLLAARTFQNTSYFVFFFFVCKGSKRFCVSIDLKTTDQITCDIRTVNGGQRVRTWSNSYFQFQVCIYERRNKHLKEKEKKKKVSVNHLPIWTFVNQESFSLTSVAPKTKFNLPLMVVLHK